MKEENNDSLKIQNLIMKLEEKSFVSKYQEACKILENWFGQIESEHEEIYDRKMIQKIAWRIKKGQSCVDKLIRKEKKLSVNSAINNLNDLAGIRVICNYIDDVYQLKNIVLSNENYKIIKEKDFIKKPKKNGYRSIHLIMLVAINECENVKVEVQIRTVAMEMWHNLEHDLVYKDDKAINNKKLCKKIRKFSDEIYKIDKKLMNIRKKILKDN